MKMLSRLITWLACAPLTLSAQVKVDIQGDKLNSDVTRIDEYCYNFSDNGEQSKTTYKTSIYAYDNKSNKVTALFISLADGPNAQYKELYFYDARNNLTAKECYIGSRPDVKTIYKYDGNGKLIESQESGIYAVSDMDRRSDTIRCKYDAAGNKTEENHYHGTTLRETLVYTYDTNRHVIKKNIYRSSTLFAEEQFSYAPSYQHLVTQQKRADGYQRKTEYSYDDRMHLIRQESYTKPAKAKRFKKDSYILHREYKYDEKGNWIAQVDYLYGKKNAYTVRRITY